MRVPWDRGGLRSYLLVLALCAGYTTPKWIVFGTPLLLAGIGLHLWAKGCLHQNREVTTAGPYRFVRHPFYLANAFLDGAIVVMSGCWWLQLAFPAWWLAVYIPVMKREEAAMQGLFGESYVRYQERVPRFIPWRRPLPHGEGGFSWSNPHLLRTEVPRSLRFASYPLLFLLAHRVYALGTGRIFSLTLPDLVTVAACAALYGSARVWRTHLKHHRRILPRWMAEDPVRVLLLLGIIATGALVTRFELESDWILWPLGLALLVTSTLARRKQSQQPVVAEGLLAVGFTFLTELVWLGFLLVPVYLAIGMDKRLSPAYATGTRPEGPGQHIGGVSDRAYALLLTASVALSAAKELLS